MAGYSLPDGERIEAAFIIAPDGTHVVAQDSADGKQTVVVQSRSYVWDAIGLGWVKGTQAVGGGGGGGAITVADGADITQGTIGDVAVVGDTVGTVSAKLRGINKALAGTLTVTGSGGTFPVTGTFWQATQPISGNVGLLSGSAVIGHVIVDTAPTTAVTGTFWQATQPVSGTFWQATQPVSIAAHVTVDQGTAGASKWLVTADPITFASAQHVIIDSGSVTATLSAETSKVIGTVNQGTSPWVANISQFGGVNISTGTGASGTGIPRVTVSNDSNILATQSGTWNIGTVTTVTTVATLTTITNAVTVTPPTLTKGTQGATGFSVQDLKDAGRSQIMLSWEEMAGTAAAESALTNFTLGSKAAAALAAATNYTVTAAKTLRIQAVTIYLKSTSTVELLARFRIRQAASSIANNSPVIFDAVMALPSATVAATEGDQLVIPIPDGLEVAAGQQITFTWFTSANTSTVGMSITGYEY